MVISGGNFKPDTLKPKEVVSLLLDDEELEKKCMCSLCSSIFPVFHFISLWNLCFYLYKHMYCW